VEEMMVLWAQINQEESREGCTRTGHTSSNSTRRKTTEEDREGREEGSSNQRAGDKGELKEW
jgi:hypothetical protein